MNRCSPIYESNSDFLSDVRNEDGDQPIPALAEAEDEPFILEGKGK